MITELEISKVSLTAFDYMRKNSTTYELRKMNTSSFLFHMCIFTCTKTSLKDQGEQNQRHLQTMVKLNMKTAFRQSNNKEKMQQKGACCLEYKKPLYLAHQGCGVVRMWYLNRNSTSSIRIWKRTRKPDWATKCSQTVFQNLRYRRSSVVNNHIS